MTTSVPDKAKLIPLGDDVQLMVGRDGVWLGFFPEHGPPAIINVEDLAHSEPIGVRSRSALATWAADRRAAASAGT